MVQKASAPTASPPLREPRARQAGRLAESLRNWTRPSPIRTLTPPGCRLRAETIACSLGTSMMLDPTPQSQPRQLGGATWLYSVATYQANPQPSEYWRPKVGLE